MFFKPHSSALGIDIGTSSIKIVELKNEKSYLELENYGEYRPSSLEDKPLLIESSSFFIFEDELSVIIKKILKEAGIKEKKVSFSLPVFSSFFTVVEFPMMNPEEIPGAVNFQAQQYIPVPMEDVVLDWQVIEEVEENRKGGKIKILLVAVPKDVIEKYSKLARDSELKLEALEIESFAFTRSLVGESKDPCLILDIGGRTSSVTIVDGGVIRFSHSLDISGFAFTKTISRKLNISIEKAEEIKKTKGIGNTSDDLVASALYSSIDKMIFSIERFINEFHSSNPKKKIGKIILSGGGSLMPGLKEYFLSKLKIEVEAGNPLKDVIYSSALEKFIKELGPFFATSIGLASRSIQVRQK